MSGPHRMQGLQTTVGGGKLFGMMTPIQTLWITTAFNTSSVKYFSMLLQALK